MVQGKLSRRRATFVAVGLLGVSQLAPRVVHLTPAFAANSGAVSASQSSAGTQGNSGDIKISQTTTPAHGNQGNEPHVPCQFYVLGFNFAAGQGTIDVASWPPTGDGSIVLADTYKATSDTSGAYQFVKGPYSLPDGHYKVYVTDNKGVSIAKQKVFWVDPCPPAPTNTPTDTPTNTPTDTPTNTPTDTPTDTPSPTAPSCGGTNCGPGVTFTVSRQLLSSRLLRTRLSHSAAGSTTPNGAMRLPHHR